MCIVTQLLLNRKGARLDSQRPKSGGGMSVVPPPCCVPSELAPLTMLLIEQVEGDLLNPLNKPVEDQRKHQDGVLKVVNYENMSAQSCGCR